ncbi:hypothetical protein [Patulibacter sp. SYSU D01012]|uniref:hypothetical protein n=1 Tax=Patulibacter sp. SYSU D01012 TaxID=2817381 RepID=UPI001B306DC0|nr:hypothetical protein [Patulibacter sp. SYSU D01012]
MLQALVLTLSFFAAWLLTTVVHELGHAKVAEASRENVLVEVAGPPLVSFPVGKFGRSRTLVRVGPCSLRGGRCLHEGDQLPNAEYLRLYRSGWRATLNLSFVGAAACTLLSGLLLFVAGNGGLVLGLVVGGPFAGVPFLHSFENALVKHSGKLGDDGDVNHGSDAWNVGEIKKASRHGMQYAPMLMNDDEVKCFREAWKSS